LLDRLGVTELHGRLDVPTGSLKGTLGDLTGSRPLFTDEQSLAFEQGGLDFAAPSPWMTWRHDEDELVEDPGRDALFAEPKRMPSDHAKIHLVPTDLLFDEGGVRNAQAQGHARIFFLERRDDAREHIVVAAVIYTGEWLLSVPVADARVDATLGGFVSLLILGWWRG
jgi:hypothetical protein